MTSEIRNNATMSEAQKAIRDAGFKNSSFDWEDDEHIFAFSLESARNTRGASICTAHYNKRTKYFTVS